MNNRISVPLQIGMQSVSLAELEIKPPSGRSLFGIKSSLIVELVSNYVGAQSRMKISDSFYACDETDDMFQGFVMVKEPRLSDFHWIIGMTNANAGRSKGFDLHSGIVIPWMENCIAIMHSERVIKKYQFFAKDDLQVLVNERLDVLREHFNLHHERETHYKKIKIDNADAHDIICKMISTEVMAGRSSKRLLDAWHKAPFDYVKPRTVWSLYCLSAWLLNHLTAPEMIERTIMLHHFFDDVAKFDKKPTKWVQTTFA